MAVLMGWLAWYSGGRVYDSVSTAWSALPAEGCLGVVEFRADCRVIHSGEWYWTDGVVRSVPGDLPGVDTPPPAGVPRSLLKRGQTVDDAEWESVRMAMRDA